MEFDDLTFSYMNPIVGAQRKVREPVGDSLPNQEIFRRLAAAMGYDEPELHESDEVLIERLLDGLDLGLSHSDLAERGHVYLTEEPFDYFADRRFRTPSGRIEIASASLTEVGLDPVPTPATDPAQPEGLFRLLTPASRWRLNDSHANDRTIGRRSGPATVTVHPADAADLGITDGDLVQLRNGAGEITLATAIGDIAPRGVLVAYKGRWPKLEPGGCNVNALHEGNSADIEGCSAVHGTLVSLEPAR
ncbi:MAG: hypothetical protein F4Y66_09075 [Acidimicrobiales bacterium]|nr:hypothetical protein [Acidimicrobiales bacterium]